jgi:hypothetical protein
MFRLMFSDARLPDLATLQTNKPHTADQIIFILLLCILARVHLEFQFFYRKKELRDVLLDDSEYHPTRPGVIVPSKSRSTTSGILVKDEAGATYMTVASHGSPDEEVEVYHPDPNGKVIGRVVDRIGDTDIALVKLRHDIQFENRTFKSDEEPAGVWFKTIKDLFQMRRYDKIAMDNSFTGLIDGQYIAVAMQRIRDTDSTKHLWVEQNWLWFGQDPAKVPREGSCGSAIYDEDGDVIAFFRFFSDDEGFGIGVAAQELLRVGYTPVVSTGR